jgi:hypothetical protein
MWIGSARKGDRIGLNGDRIGLHVNCRCICAGKARAAISRLRLVQGGFDYWKKKKVLLRPKPQPSPEGTPAFFICSKTLGTHLVCPGGKGLRSHFLSTSANRRKARPPALGSIKDHMADIVLFIESQHSAPKRKLFDPPSNRSYFQFKTIRHDGFFKWISFPSFCFNLER